MEAARVEEREEEVGSSEVGSSEVGSSEVGLPKMVSLSENILLAVEAGVVKEGEVWRHGGLEARCRRGDTEM